MFHNKKPKKPKKNIEAALPSVLPIFVSAFCLLFGLIAKAFAQKFLVYQFCGQFGAYCRLMQIVINLAILIFGTLLVVELGLLSLRRRFRRHGLPDFLIPRKILSYRRLMHQSLIIVTLFMLAVLLMKPWDKALDWTVNKTASLSAQSEKMIRSIEHSVSIRAYYQVDDPIGKAIRPLLTQMAANNKHISLQYLDRGQEIIQAQKDQVPSNGYIVFANQQGQKNRLALNQYRQIDSLTQQGMSLLLRVGRQPIEIAYEDVSPSLADPFSYQDMHQGAGLNFYYFRKILEQGNFRLRPLAFDVKSKQPWRIPEAAKYLIAGYNNLPGDVFYEKAILDFLARGGKILLLLEAQSQFWQGMLAKHFRISIVVSTQGFIRDPKHSIANNDQWLLVDSTKMQAKSLAGLIKLPASERISIWPNNRILLQPIDLPDLLPNVNSPRVLVQTADSAWFDRDGDGQQNDEPKGPLALALALKFGLAERQPAGDNVYMLANAASFSGQWLINPGNEALARAVVDQMTADIRLSRLVSKPNVEAVLPFNDQQVGDMFWLFLLVFPMAMTLPILYSVAKLDPL